MNTENQLGLLESNRGIIPGAEVTGAPDLPKRAGLGRVAPFDCVSLKVTYGQDLMSTLKNYLVNSWGQALGESLNSDEATRRPS